MRRAALTLFVLPVILTPLACADDGAGDGADLAATETAGSDEIGPTSESGTTDAGTSTDTTAGTSTDTTAGTSTDTTAGTTDSTDTDTTDGTDTTGGNDEVLTFIAMGDAGEGNEAQYAVAAAIEQVCVDKGGCEFVLYLGDNFYDDGVASAMDDQFQTKFELPYADLDMPFRIVLGNHDYGALSFAWEKSAYEIEYSNYSDKWTLPNEWYAFAHPNADFFVFDTTRFMWNHQTGTQQDWMNTAIGNSGGHWKIAAGHHPYYSNGEHGNAGNYEGFPFPPQLAGTTVKEVFDESVCGKVDLYLSGHDHNRQWFQPTCSGGDRTTHFIVSGAGSKTTGFVYHGGGNETHWENDSTPGFLLLQVSFDMIHTEFYDQNGTFEFERDITK